MAKRTLAAWVLAPSISGIFLFLVAPAGPSVAYAGNTAEVASSLTAAGFWNDEGFPGTGAAVHEGSRAGTDSSRALRFLKYDASVWGQDQIIRGVALPPIARNGVLLVNGTPVPFTLPAGSDTFAVPVFLHEGMTRLVARVDSAGIPVYSDTLRLTLAYALRPRVAAHATVAGRSVTLHGVIEENPDSAGLTFSWTADARNPGALTVQNASDTLASALIPSGAPSGEYYFTLRVRASDGDSARARTYVTVRGDSVARFVNGIDHAHWIDSAVLYEILPSCFIKGCFVPGGKLRAITRKVPELADLGVTALWLMPVMSTPELNEGYHTTDYFGLREDLGTEAELHELVQTAHAHGLKVMFDIVPNHSSLEHPWAQEAIRYGPLSHYYDYYQRAPGTSFYGYDERTIQYGLMTFTVFWYRLLVNLNFDNPEVQRMMTDAGRYWIEKFDIDGYRVDMIWAANARNPEYFKAWCRSLKSLKPEILLLAEDVAGNVAPGKPVPFDLGYDAAYDWTRNFKLYWRSSGEMNLPSTYAWIMSNAGQGFPPRAIIVRGLENNDLSRAIVNYGQTMERMLSVMQFTLHGIPMLFNGQEIGATTHPYDGEAIFLDDVPIRSLDRESLFPFFRKLARMRRMYPALHSANFEQVMVAPAGQVYAYRRWEGKQNIFCLANVSTVAAPAVLPVPSGRLGLDSARVHYLTDLMNGEIFQGRPSQLANLPVPVNPLTVRVLLLDTVAVTALPDEEAEEALPAEFALEQNYPNPFNPSTLIRFQLPAPAAVHLTVYDVLGRAVRLLLDQTLDAGSHEVRFEATGLASGLYIYRLQAGAKAISKKMLYIR